MIDDRRVAFRKNAFTFGVLDLAAGARACLVWDVTGSGAQIEVEEPDSVPDRFALRLSADSDPRPVSVAWRRSHRIGLVFEG